MRDARPQRALHDRGGQARRRAARAHRFRPGHRRGRRAGQPLPEGPRHPRRRHPHLRRVRRRLPGPRCARPHGDADDRRLPGRVRHPDEPGHAGYHHVRAAPHGRPGPHHRRRRHRLSGGIPRRLPQTPRRPRHRQDDVLLLHLRPPHHPGRGVGPPPGPGGHQALGTRRLLRARLYLDARSRAPLRVGSGLRLRPEPRKGQARAHRGAHPRLPFAWPPRRRH